MGAGPIGAAGLGSQVTSSKLRPIKTAGSAPPRPTRAPEGFSPPLLRQATPARCLGRIPKSRSTLALRLSPRCRRRFGLPGPFPALRLASRVSQARR